MNKPFYLTFNDTDTSPYGLGEYIIVYGKNIHDASEIYNNYYPNKIKDSYSYAYIYDEKNWKDSISQFYDAKEPSEIIGCEQEDPMQIYVVEQNGECELGYATNEEIAKRMVETLSKDNPYLHSHDFSIYPAFLNQVLVKDKVICFEEDEQKEETIEDLEM